MGLFSILKYKREVFTEPLHPKGTHPPIPDWKSFKIQNAPELLRLQKELAAYGLKDPWLRNEIWRYDVRFFPSSKWARLLLFHFRGFRLGLVLAVAHATIKTLVSGSDHGH